METDSDFSMQSMNFCGCVRVLCTREKRTRTHGARRRLLAKNSHIASFYNKDEKRYISYLPVRFSTRKTENVMKPSQSQFDFWWMCAEQKQASGVCDFSLQFQDIFYLYKHCIYTWIMCMPSRRLHRTSKAKSSANPLLLELLLVEKDIVLNFHMLVSPDMVDKYKLCVHTHTHTHTHTHAQAATHTSVAIECKVNHRSRQYLCQTLWPWRIDIGRFAEPWQQSSVNPADEKSVFVL